jgi:RND family efflux transporter MFP subunit
MKYHIKISAIVLLAFIIQSCDSKKTENDKAKQKKEDYTLMILQPHETDGSVKLPGLLQPFEFVQIFPKVSGFVKDVYVDRGSIVRQGQVLMRLEAPEIEQRVSAAKLKYTEAHAMYMTSKDKYYRLLETSKTPGTVSLFDLEATHSKMLADSATAQGEYANYKAQQAMSGYLTVTAPFSGVITDRNVHPGALVGPEAHANMPMLVLQQQSKLRMVINVPEEYSAQVRDNSIVHFTVNAIPGKDFKGKVARTAGSLNDKFRSEAIEVDVENPNNLFKPGMYAEVTLTIDGNKDAFFVPKSAVVTTTERKYVIAVNNNYKRWVDISEGNPGKDSTEVFGNLHAGDQIIVNADYQIKESE